MADDHQIRPMTSFRFIFISLTLLLVSSCAKLSYMVEQGMGQVSIQFNGVKNQKILNDPKVLNEHKEKIKAIAEYKKYFENYFDLKFDDIYEKTTFLEREAASYMVTASPVGEIKAHHISFPFVGRFPYLAFFKVKSAKSYAKRLEEKGLVTYIRPVYAYSSLNYFDDRILSSFFQYTKTELAELVFHELTHLVFFAKNDVGFNESLAQYVSHQVLTEYLKNSPSNFLKKRTKSRSLSKELVPLVRELNDLYATSEEYTNEEYVAIHKQFLVHKFFPILKKNCVEAKRKNCDYKVERWNNARLVGFMNYEGTYEKIENLHRKSGLNLREFISLIDKVHEEKNNDTNFLKKLEMSVKGIGKE